MKLFLIGLLAFPLVSNAVEEDCDELYFGIDIPRDVDKAFRCFSAQKNDSHAKLFLALMHLNGEGTKKDPAKAKLVLNEVQEEELAKKALGAQIEKQLDTPSEAPVDYCSDIAQAQLDLNSCAFMASRQATRDRQEAEKKIAATAKPKLKKAMQKLSKAFAKYSENESNYAMAQYEGGSIAPLIGASVVKSQENAYRELLETTFAKTPDSDFKKADAELNKLYQDLTTKIPEKQKTMLRDVQRSWIVFRDALVEFVSVKEPKAKEAAKARVTQMRSKDLTESLKDIENG